jgi:hypothetical protein
MFPNFQFILTTHSPLTAQQAGAGELFLMRRPAPSDPPVLEPSPIEPRTMLVHQLLMSPAFGIGTPDSVAVETMKKDYVRLSGIKNRNADDQARFEQLEEALKDLPDGYVVPERDARRDQLLADIKAALDKQGR